MIVPRRAAVLLEMVIALAIFVTGATMLTQLQTSITRSLDRARLSTEAADLARKTLAELEAGIIELADLRTMRVRTEQSKDRMEREFDADELGEPSPWRLSVHTERSPYEGLTLVALTVAHVGETGATTAPTFDEPTSRNEVRVTIRQLMRLRDEMREPTEGGS